MPTIQDFEELKTQLAELAKVVNTFNSEAVQIKIVEIVLSEYLVKPPHASHHTETQKEISPKKKSKARRKPKSTGTPSDGDNKKTKGKTTGASSILTVLIADGFFSERQTINNIIDQAKINKAIILKPNELSPSLARFVRDGRLKREKNSDGQYEYFI